MGKPDILMRIGVFLLIVSTSTSFGVDVDVEEDIEEDFPESGVIFTEPSVDLDSPFTTTTSTSTIRPEVSHGSGSKVVSAGAATLATASFDVPLLPPGVIPIAADKLPPPLPFPIDKLPPPPPLFAVDKLPPPPPLSVVLDKPPPPVAPAPVAYSSIRSKVPASFRKYIDEIRNTAAEIRWIKRDENPAPETKQHHLHPGHPHSSPSVVVAALPLPQLPPVVTTIQPPPPPPVPTLPVPPINAISAIIRDLEKQKREYESIKNVHPKLHLIPQKSVLAPKPRLELSLPVKGAPTPKEINSVELIRAKQYLAPKPRLEVPVPVGAPPPMPKEIKSLEPVAPVPVSGTGSGGSGNYDLDLDHVSWGGITSGSGRWLWSWLGLGGSGEEGSKSVGGQGGGQVPPPYPYPHPPIQKPGEGAGDHPQAGKSFKYDCPYPHETNKAVEKKWFFF